MTTEWGRWQSLTFIFVPGTIEDQTTVSPCVFCQKKKKATSNSYCYSVRWSESSGYSWLKAKLKETLSAMPDVCVMLFDPARTMGRPIKRAVILSCFCITTDLLPRFDNSVLMTKHILNLVSACNTWYWGVELAAGEKVWAGPTVQWR